jgi:inhibitor of the pro-sigma K processing machinery
MHFDYNVIFAYIFGIIIVYVVARLLFVPIKIVLRLIYNALIGGAAIWIINFIGNYLGFHIGLNPVTALVVGVLGIPGAALLFLIQYFI